MEIAWWDSPAGRLWLAADEAGLRRVEFPPHAAQRRGAGPGAMASTAAAPAAAPGPGNAGAVRVLATTCRQLAEYFAGRRTAFDVPLAPEGTAFQLRVWAELRRIPYGQTISYGELARRVGQPRAARAVGAANGANPIPIIVPCHRVIGASGKLTGFGGGLDVKAQLLALESAQRRLADPFPGAAVSAP